MSYHLMTIKNGKAVLNTVHSEVYSDIKSITSIAKKYDEVWVFSGFYTFVLNKKNTKLSDDRNIRKTYSKAFDSTVNIKSKLIKNQLLLPDGIVYMLNSIRKWYTMFQSTKDININLGNEYVPIPVSKQEQINFVTETIEILLSEFDDNELFLNERKPFNMVNIYSWEQNLLNNSDELTETIGDYFVNCIFELFQSPKQFNNFVLELSGNRF